MNSKVVANSFVYSISGLLIKCFSLFLIPLYTAYLSTEEYGITGISTHFITVLSFVVAFSLYSAIARFYVEKKQDIVELRRFYGTITVFVFISSVVFVAVLFGFRDYLSRNIFAGEPFVPVILCSLISLVFSCQHNIYDNILRAEQKAAKCSIVSVLYFFVNISLTIYFVTQRKLGAVGVICATMIANFLFSLVFVVDMLINQKITFCIDLRILRESLKYTVPIIPHNLSTRIASLFSTVIIGNAYSLSSLGIYTLALQFGNVADAVQTYVNYAYNPWFFEQMETRKIDYQQTIRKYSNILVEVIGFFMIGISLFSPDYIFLFLSDGYKESWVFVPCIVFGYVIKSIYYFYVSVLLYYKNASKYIFIATVSSSIIGTVLTTLFVPKYGPFGAAAADIVATVLLSIIVYLLSTKFESVGLNVYDFFKNIAIIILVIIAGLFPTKYYFDSSFSWMNFFYKCLIVMMYLLICYKRNQKEILVILKRFEMRKRHE